MVWLLVLLMVLGSMGVSHGKTIKTHALCLGGEPKYGQNFSHYGYVWPNAPKGGELRRFSIGAFNKFNPFIPKGHPAAAGELTTDSLCVRSLDEYYTVYGLIAQYMEFAQEENQRSWIIFHINPLARFHDNVPITAHDVVFSFNTLNNNIGNGFRRFFQHVKKVEALDDHRVKFSFSSGASKELPLIVSSLPVYPKHWWTAHGPTRNSLEIPVGCGPYQVKSFRFGRNIIYSRVKDYWAANLPVCKGLYNFDTIKYEYFREPTVALEAFKAGLYDMRLELSTRHWKALQNIDNVVVRKLKHEQPRGIEGFFFNTRRPPFDDPKVRKALLLAFDWEWTNAHLLQNEFTRCNSYFMNSDLSAADNSPDGPAGAEAALLASYRDKIPPEIMGSVKKLPSSQGDGFNRSNLGLAAGLLREAGFLVEKGCLKDSQGQCFRFRLLTDSQAMQRIALPWIRNLKRMGIHASVHLCDSAQFIRRMQDYDFDMIASAYGQRIWPGQEQLLYWHSDFKKMPGGRNFIGLADPIVDELVKALVNAGDRKSLAGAGRALDRVLMQGDYVIPLGISTTYNLALHKRIGIPKIRPGFALGHESWWAIPAEE